MFRRAYEKKLESVIAPVFFAFANELSYKISGVSVGQYANDVECLFSLKNKQHQSELLMRYDGFAKLNVTITHKGLDTPDNSVFDIPINKIDDKYLYKILKKFSDDFLNICIDS